MKTRTLAKVTLHIHGNANGKETLPLETVQREAEEDAYRILRRLFSPHTRAISDAEHRLLELGPVEFVSVTLRGKSSEAT